MAQPVDFFVYGTLLDMRRMTDEAGEWDVELPARLPDHRLRFARWSESWRGAAADLEPSPGESVYGVVYRIFAPQFIEISKRRPGTVGTRVTVETDEGQLAVSTLVATCPEEGLKRSRAYVDALDEGMRQRGFSQEIRARLRTWADQEAGPPGAHRS